MNFQQQIIQYLVNKIVPQTPSNDIFIWRIPEAVELSISPWDENGILPTNYTSLDYVGYVVDNQQKNIILYGSYTKNNQTKGIITVIDEYFNPIKTFYTFDNGTALNPIQCIRQAEDNTFYWVDKSSSLRFVMVNNFVAQNTQGELVLSFRKSYNFDNSYNNYVCKEMYKNAETSHYSIFSSYNTNVKVTDLKINVGESNEWSTLTYNNYTFMGAISTFNSDDNIYWRMMVNPTSASNVTCITKNYNGTTSTTNISLDAHHGFMENQVGQCVFKNVNDVYFVLTDESIYNSVLQTNFIRGYNYNFDSEETYTFLSMTTPVVGYRQAISLAVCDDIVYFEMNQNIKYINSLIPEQVGFFAEEYFFGNIRSDINFVRFDVTRNNKPYNKKNNFFVAKNNYNLAQQISLYIGEALNKYSFLINSDYNSLNYNSTKYIDFNCMIPTKAEIKSNNFLDINGKNSLVFARNLYDKTINANRTTSTVVVPNTYLNNININEIDLLSQTNITLVNKKILLSKNIYEALYLNFIVVLNVIDDNNNNGTLLSGVGDYVTTNINIGTQENCLNSFIGKIVVNYNDGTSLINPIVWSRITNLNYKTEFALQVEKEILNIEFKSNDLTQTYLTVIPDDLTIGSIYKFTQYLKIE